MKRLLVMMAVGMVSGCANDPFTVHQMTRDELQYVRDDELCRTYTFRGLYSGATPAVATEVAERGLDCGAKVTPAISPRKPRPVS